MLQTPIVSKKYSSFSPLSLLAEMTTGGKLRQQSAYPSIPARYSGLPNFMHYCIGSGADLQCAVLMDADLRWSNFRGANLRETKLNGSILWGSILTNADLNGADLSHADFTGVDLIGANLTDAIVEGTCFLGARYSQTTQFPKGFGHPEQKGLVSLNESMQLAG